MPSLLCKPEFLNGFFSTGKSWHLVDSLDGSDIVQSRQVRILINILIVDDNMKKFLIPY